MLPNETTIISNERTSGYTRMGTVTDLRINLKKSNTLSWMVDTSPSIPDKDKEIVWGGVKEKDLPDGVLKDLSSKIFSSLGIEKKDIKVI